MSNPWDGYIPAETLAHYQTAGGCIRASAIDGYAHD